MFAAPACSLYKKHLSGFDGVTLGQLPFRVQTVDLLWSKLIVPDGAGFIDHSTLLIGDCFTRGWPPSVGGKVIQSVRRRIDRTFPVAWLRLSKEPHGRVPNGIFPA